MQRAPGAASGRKVFASSGGQFFLADLRVSKPPLGFPTYLARKVLQTGIVHGAS